jgi:ZIP family zinc transporter
MWFIPLIILLIVLSIITIIEGSGGEKVLFISWISFFSMISPIITKDIFNENAKYLVWAYGISSGSMIISAALFMLPGAFRNLPKAGGIGIGIGILVGYSIHTISHNTSHRLEKFLHGKKSVISLTLHTVFAGLALGIIYSQTPSISAILGISIVSHKLPASFSTVRELENKRLVVIPSVLFGISCLISFLFIPELSELYITLIFGIGAGVFIHMAMDFLPECERGDIYDIVSQTEEEHEIIDRLRYHAMASVAVGGIIVLILWLIS